MKRSTRLLSILALTIGLCTSAAFAATLAQTYSNARVATFETPAVLAIGMDYRDVTPSVKDELSKQHGIPGVDRPGVVETAVAAAVIWAVALACLLLVAPQATSEPRNEGTGLPHAH